MEILNQIMSIANYKLSAWIVVVLVAGAVVFF